MHRELPSARVDQLLFYHQVNYTLKRVRQPHPLRKIIIEAHTELISVFSTLWRNCQHLAPAQFPTFPFQNTVFFPQIQFPFVQTPILIFKLLILIFSLFS